MTRWRPLIRSSGRVGWLILLFAVAMNGCGESSREERLRGVVMILLDTVRADRLGCYGHDRPTSPHLDALAGEGVRFEQVVASAPWTLPSVAAMLAGQYAERVFHQKLESSIVETLQADGIETAAFTEGGFVSKFFGLDRGFDSWHEEEGEVQFLAPGQLRDTDPTGGIDRTFANAERWLAERDDEPFFLLVHTYEPHTPYTSRQFTTNLDPGRLGTVFSLDQVGALGRQELVLTDSEVEYVTAMYDGDIATADRFVGRLLAQLDELDLADEVAVVVTSDHGEALGSHYPSRRFDHGHSLRDGALMVPLILRDPSREIAGMVIDEQVRTIDVLPTIADLLDVELDGERDGQSLLSYVTDDESKERPALLGQTKLGPQRVGVRAAGYKYIKVVDVPGPRRSGLFPPPARRQLYETEADPAESRNLATERRPMAEAFDQMLLDTHPGRDQFISPEVADEADDELLERLRSLGYLR